MSVLATFMKLEIEMFLFALAGLVAVKLLTGEINTNRLLFGRISGKPSKNNQDRYFSPERVQLLFITIGSAFYYLQLVLNNPNASTLPDIPQTLPAAVGGSNAIYLVGKACARWLGKNTVNSNNPNEGT